MPKKKKIEEKPTLAAQFDNKININSYVEAAFVEGSGDEEVTVERTVRGGRNSYSATTIKKKYQFINEQLDPFNYKNCGYVDIKDVLELVEKAYFSAAIVRNVIESNVELCNTPIYLKGGNKKSRTFIEKWLEKIGIWKMCDQWFRCYWLYGNVYPYSFDSTLSSESLRQLTTVYGKEFEAKAAVKLPIKYVFLNPIKITRETGFVENGDFYQILSRREIDKIIHPKTPDEQDFAKLFTEAEKKQMKNSSTFMMKLDPTKLHYTGFKILDFFPFAIPFVYPALENIDYKMLLKKLDREIAKTFDFAILLFRVGIESNGQLLINKDTITNLQTLFKNPKLQRVLVCGLDVDAKWVVPPIDELLGAKKYEQCEKDLKNDLLSALFSDGEKFASLSIKVKAYAERLQEPRQCFLEEFLNNEIKAVSKQMGFRNPPKAHFVDIDLEDTVTLRRLYMRLYELGGLTPFDVENAIDKGILPEKDEMLENQQEYADLRKKGLFSPILNQKNDETGRPAGSSGSPQSTKRVKPIGTKASFSMSAIAKTLSAFEKLESDISKSLKKTVNKEDLERMTFNIAQSIALSTKPDEWLKSTDKFIKSPEKPKQEVLAEISEIEDEFELEERLATVLWLSNQTEPKV